MENLGYGKNPASATGPLDGAVLVRDPKGLHEVLACLIDAPGLRSDLAERDHRMEMPA